ncbi:MAG: hypothetical protein JWM76_1260, partial [Pseudonocardiales bacterium]|nr:hypothetical protein [Pseudonocardiales bacterium]
PDDIAWDALVAGLGTAGMTPADVQGVLVSHAHRDHHGLSGRLRAESGCWIGMHPADIEILQRFADGSALAARGTPFLALVGAPPAQQSEITDVRPALRLLADTIPDRPIEHGDRDLVSGRQVSAVWTPGHTPGHLCFVDEALDYLFSGDHLLPRITPHVGGYVDGTGDQLGQYLSSLDELRPYDGAEVLPAHEYRFRGVAARIDAMRSHHQLRLDEVEAVVRARGGATVWEVASCLRWSRGWDETTDVRRRLALAETLAHLRHLDALGRLFRSAHKTPHWRVIDRSTSR